MASGRLLKLSTDPQFTCAVFLWYISVIWCLETRSVLSKPINIKEKTNLISEFMRIYSHISLRFAIKLVPLPIFQTVRDLKITSKSMSNSLEEIRQSNAPIKSRSTALPQTSGRRILEYTTVGISPRSRSETHTRKSLTVMHD